MLNYQRVYHISQFIAQGEGSQPAIPGMEEDQRGCLVTGFRPSILLVTNERYMGYKTTPYSD